MNFRSLYAHGFARVAACTHHTALADPGRNADAMLTQARECAARGAVLAIFPELGLSSYSIEDLLLQDALLDAVERAVGTLLDGSADLGTVIVVGAPLRHAGRI